MVDKIVWNITRYCRKLGHLIQISKLVRIQHKTMGIMPTDKSRWLRELFNLITSYSNFLSHPKLVILCWVYYNMWGEICQSKWMVCSFRFQQTISQIHIHVVLLQFIVLPIYAWKQMCTAAETVYTYAVFPAYDFNHINALKHNNKFSQLPVMLSRYIYHIIQIWCTTNGISKTVSKTCLSNVVLASMEIQEHTSNTKIYKLHRV